jgi:hypothetical protein
MKERAIKDANLSTEYTAFLINFLMTKKSGSGRISQLLLEKNGIDTSLDYFIRMQDAEKNGRAYLTHKGYNYYTFKISQTGITYSNILPHRNKIILLTMNERINLYVLTRIWKSINGFFISVDKIMSMLMKSWIKELLLLIITGLMLLAEFDNILKFFERFLK